MSTDAADTVAIAQRHFEAALEHLLPFGIGTEADSDAMMAAGRSPADRPRQWLIEPTLNVDELPLTLERAARMAQLFVMTAIGSADTILAGVDGELDVEHLRRLLGHEPAGE